MSSPVPTNISPATLDDLEAIQRLLGQLGYTLDLPVLREQCELYSSSPFLGLWLARRQTAIAGLIAVSLTPLFIKKAWRVHVEALVVDAAYRHQGIGRALLEHIEYMTSPYGPRIIDLTSGQHRAATGAHAFYKSLGYNNEGSNEKVYLRKELGK